MKKVDWKYPVTALYAVFAITIAEHGAWGLAVAYFLFGAVYTLIIFDFDVSRLWIAGNKHMIPAAKMARFGSFVGIWATLVVYDLARGAHYDLPDKAISCVCIAVAIVVLGPLEYRRYRQ